MAGMKLYVQRHDGQAVTVEDFIRCSEDATGRDLTQFFRWYTQAGTPELTFEWEHDAESRTFTLRVRQHTPPTPGQEEKLPLHMPLKIALFDRQGRKLALLPKGGREITDGLLEIREREQAFVFEQVAEPPVVSLNRGFSAPVKVRAPLTPDDLLLLLAHEDDGVARAEAAGQLWQRHVLAHYEGAPEPVAALAEALAAAVRELRGADAALLAELLTPPGMGMLMDALSDDIDPERLQAARNAVMGEVARALAGLLSETFALARVEEPYAPTPAQAGRRALQAAILKLMVAADEKAGAKAAFATWREARNMTEMAMALTALALTDTEERERAMAEYVERFGDDPLLMDKWLSWQAMWPFPPCVHNLHELMESRWFTLSNPNRVRALLGAFAHANPVCFTATDGAGFDLIAQAVAKLDAMNPTAAARLASSFRLIGRLEPGRRKRARAVLERLATAETLSQDTRDIILRILGRA
jgi:aminopeptidase N